MAAIRCPPEDMELLQSRPAVSGESSSGEERSVAGDSWSVKSDCGSTLDDEQLHMDGSDALFSANSGPTSDYGSDKGEQDHDVETPALGLQSWDAIYTNQLVNFNEHGQVGELWLGSEITGNMVDWTRNLCINVSHRCMQNLAEDCNSEIGGELGKCLSGWNVLDIGTGNGLLLHELAKKGFSDLTGIDYSEAAIDLARNLAVHEGFANIIFLVDDILQTKLERKFKLVIDRGSLDAIGLHSDGPLKRTMFWESLLKLVAPGGILVITSRYSTKDDLVQEVENLNLNQRIMDDSEHPKDHTAQGQLSSFRYLDNIRTHSPFASGQSRGSHVETIAFSRI